MGLLGHLILIVEDAQRKNCIATRLSPPSGKSRPMDDVSNYEKQPIEIKTGILGSIRCGFGPRQRTNSE